jgi:hypothetical protein
MVQRALGALMEWRRAPSPSRFKLDQQGCLSMDQPKKSEDPVTPVDPVETPVVTPDNQDSEAEDSTSETAAGGMISEGSTEPFLSDVTEAPPRLGGEGGMIGEG